MFVRDIQPRIMSFLNPKKAIMLIGPRQVGKTTLLKQIIGNQNHLFLSGDDAATRQLFEINSLENIKRVIAKHRLVFVDEAQRINNIGTTLKIIIDQIEDVQLLVSGSSALELNTNITESLTGRKWQFELFPLSWKELSSHLGFVNALFQLENRLIYGSYPEVLNREGQEIDVLNEIVNSYLYKDILALTNIRKADQLEKLLKALALQIGGEANINELSNLLRIDNKTVENYIHLLKQAYVLFELPAFSGNERTEIRRGKKFYFYDNGVRNALIQNFNPLSFRNDVGALWENYFIAERLKYIRYKPTYAKLYFWRTTQMQEIDLIEQEGATLRAFELKWNPKTKVKISKTFSKNYDAQVEIVHRENFMKFLED
ncbi:MAG: ATP-binding protein [Flavobacteriales bacterium]|nr:ATP-binding protein [Flavobacteriales bacterium]